METNLSYLTKNGNTKKIGSKINDRKVKLKKKPSDALLLTAKARLQMRPLDQFELKHNNGKYVVHGQLLFDKIGNNTELRLTLVLFCVCLS